MNPERTAVFHFDTLAPLCPVVLLKDALCVLHKGTKSTHTYIQETLTVFSLTECVNSEHRRSVEVGQTVPVSQSMSGALLTQPTNNNALHRGSTSELSYKAGRFVEQPETCALLWNEKQEQSFAVERKKKNTKHSDSILPQFLILLKAEKSVLQLDSFRSRRGSRRRRRRTSWCSLSHNATCEPYTSSQCFSDR